MRDGVLNTIRTAIEADERITAAWLAGSRGRGTADALSDIDIWLAVEDEAIGEINADPLVFVHAIAPTIMHIQAPSIAPVDGVFLLTWIQTAEGFEQVDWYFVPESTARRMPDTKVLFEKRRVPVSHPERQVLTGDELWREIDGMTKDALLMIANGRKQVARGASWRAVEHIKQAFMCLEKVFWLLEFGDVPTFDNPGRRMISHDVPATPVDQLRELERCHRMLADYLSRLDCPLPYPEAFAAVEASLRATPDDVRIVNPNDR
jgi:hypothetical protein